MKFPLIIFEEPGYSFGGIMPDFKALFLFGDSSADIIDQAQDGVESWMDGEDPAIFPKPTPIDAVLKMEEAKGRAVVLVDIDDSFLDGKAARICVSLPRRQIAAIDAKAKELGLTRSALMAKGALAYGKP